MGNARRGGDVSLAQVIKIQWVKPMFEAVGRFRV